MSSVTFFSPGTFVDEITTMEISDWSTSEAMRLAARVEERYQARPFAFQFGQDAPTSGRYYINAKLRTLDEIERDGDPRDSILLSNMRSNGWPIVAVTATHTAPFEPNDAVVNADGIIVRRASDADLAEYRVAVLKRLEGASTCSS